MEAGASFYLNLRERVIVVDSHVPYTPGEKIEACLSLRMFGIPLWRQMKPQSEFYDLCPQRRETQQRHLEKVILKDFFILIDRDCLKIIQIFRKFNEVIGSLVDIN